MLTLSFDTAHADHGPSLNDAGHLDGCECWDCRPDLYSEEQRPCAAGECPASVGVECCCGGVVVLQCGEVA